MIFPRFFFLQFFTRRKKNDSLFVETSHGDRISRDISDDYDIVNTSELNAYGGDKHRVGRIVEVCIAEICIYCTRRRAWNNAASSDVTKPDGGC